MPWLISDTSHGRIHLEGEGFLFIIRISAGIWHYPQQTPCSKLVTVGENEDSFALVAY